MGTYKKKDVDRLKAQGYIPVTHAAKKAKRSRENIYYLIKRGVLGYKMFAGTMYIHVPSLDKYYGK